jgi:hypothetical protein
MTTRLITGTAALGSIGSKEPQGSWPLPVKGPTEMTPCTLLSTSLYSSKLACRHLIYACLVHRGSGILSTHRIHHHRPPPTRRSRTPSAFQTQVELAYSARSNVHYPPHPHRIWIHLYTPEPHALCIFVSLHFIRVSIASWHGYRLAGHFTFSYHGYG